MALNAGSRQCGFLWKKSDHEPGDIQSTLGNQFRQYGLDSPWRPPKLALLLRAGAYSGVQQMSTFWLEEGPLGRAWVPENIAKRCQCHSSRFLFWSDSSMILLYKPSVFLAGLP